MEKLERYRRIVRNVLTELADFKYSNPEMTHEAVFDEANDRYLVMAVGWESPVRRVHLCLVHVDIINEKVWIQRDGTEDGIGYAIEEAGVPKSDIVPAFHPVDVRPHTGYAVA